MLSNKDLLDRANSFITDSNSFFSSMKKRMKRDWAVYSGSFWDSDTIKEWHREKRPKETWNVLRVFVNAISSPFSSSPYHIQLEDRTDKDFSDLQDFIDKFEARNDSKNAIIEAISNAAVCGEGYLTLSIVDKNNNEQEVLLEVIDDPECVFMDPSCITTSGIDAEMGAIVNFMNLEKAKRLYGTDIVGSGYPAILPPLCRACGLNDVNKIPYVNFYYKDEKGRVVFSAVCGQKIVAHKVMPYDKIPIFRFTGYKSKTVDYKTEYLGVVRATWSLQVGANIGYSTLIERMNRNPKGSFLMPVGAIENLEKYYQIAGSDDSLLYLYNGNIPPTPIKESFETADLVGTINQSLQLMSNVLGIPLTGINGLNLTNKTATEVLVQETNSESNVSCFYTSAFEAIRALGMVLIGLNGFDSESITFSLQNGPSVITQNAKKRQELGLMASMMPDNMKPILAKYMADTLTDTMSQKLSKDIVANMDPSLKLVSETEEDPNAVHVLKGMQAALDSTMEQLKTSVQENMELKRQLQEANIQMLNAKTQLALDWKKFQISEQDKVRLEEAKLMASGVKADNDSKAQTEKLMLDGQKVAVEAERAKTEAFKVAADAAKGGVDAL